ncbi:MAG TPA: DinB family protein [Saprospiraceae bacterium]|nr:DinB family protein [Saprospiraceae bacterium]HMQ82319.1 DinB family protein [Saprospiraceae bacterium]
MNRTTLSKQTHFHYYAFADFIASLSDDAFLYAPVAKWSAGQQLEHLIRSISPLILALRLPKWVLILLFGKPNRPGRSYVQLVGKYTSKLHAGGRASGRYIPREIHLRQKERLIKVLKQKTDLLTRVLHRFSEKELDELLLPHPLLGKLTLREMMYFTIYHVQHHLELTQKYLGEKQNKEAY